MPPGRGQRQASRGCNQEGGVVHRGNPLAAGIWLPATVARILGASLARGHEAKTRAERLAPRKENPSKSRGLSHGQDNVGSWGCQPRRESARSACPAGPNASLRSDSGSGSTFRMLSPQTDRTRCNVHPVASRRGPDQRSSGGTRREQVGASTADQRFHVANLSPRQP